ncbi:hypothetical protein Ae201684P_007091 [Aphanomyces euteiches]|uniref:F-box domain-containing protein n=1 Tax=Aphanomyces euteiches TaxID=100861 RepID=A0A6G0WV92_9STRA|nr:hypothetical protein Ae201684_011299 [Aphanomyces euteiches]KAH9100900.1 hypothetical protein Ae201684P_007091 [Aphanomyces euteiches]KAH9138299.1 hypothetical protein AeRB84_017366 [Aphanomyces euteiches]
MTPSVPFDVFVKIAFFIHDWDTLRQFLEAFRQDDALGPLEHLWKLFQERRWNHAFLWPHLKLTRITMDPASCLHLETVAKYYSQVIVDETTDVEWIRQHIDPKTSLAWIRPTSRFNPTNLKTWQPFRISSLEKVDINPAKFLQECSSLEHVQVAKCTPEIAGVVFKHAASSSSLRRLDLRTAELNQEGHCTITTSLARDLQPWINSQPIRSFQLRRFSWESPAVRAQILASVLAKSTLETFHVEELFGDLLSLQTQYNRWSRQVTLTFMPRYDPEDKIHWNANELSVFVNVFRELLESNCTKLNVEEFIRATGEPTVVWQVLAPLVKSCKLEEFKFSYRTLTSEDASLMVETIRDHPTLRQLSFSSLRVSFEDAKAILVAAPASLETLQISPSDDSFSTQEWKELRDLAAERSITMK